MEEPPTNHPLDSIKAENCLINVPQLLKNKIAAGGLFVSNDFEGFDEINV